MTCSSTCIKPKKKLDAQKTVVTININGKYPHRQLLNRLQQAERLLVHQMIAYPEAMDFYKTNNVKFTDEFHRYIASFLAYNEEIDRENIYPIILNDINERIDDDQRQSLYRNQVIDIANEKRYRAKNLILRSLLMPTRLSSKKEKRVLLN